MHTLYDLTPMTGREASASRTVVIGTVEFNQRVWMILIWSMPVALLLTAGTWMVAGQLSLVLMVLVPAAALWLVHHRTRHGLRLRTYQAMWDKRKATLDEFFICGQRIDFVSEDLRWLVSNTVPVDSGGLSSGGRGHNGRGPGSAVSSGEPPGGQVDAGQWLGAPPEPASSRPRASDPRPDRAARPPVLHRPPATADATGGDRA